MSVAKPNPAILLYSRLPTLINLGTTKSTPLTLSIISKSLLLSFSTTVLPGGPKPVPLFWIVRVSTERAPN